MIRKTIGIILLIFGLVLKSTLNHRLEYWATVKVLTIDSFVIGLTLFFVPVIDWIKNYRRYTVLSGTRKWLLFPVKFLVLLGAFAVLVAIGVGMEQVGIFLNERIRDFYLSRNVGLTEGRIIGVTEVAYTIKSQPNYEKFFILEYQTAEGLITQGIQPNDTIRVGQTFLVNYSVKHPAFFRIK